MKNEDIKVGALVWWNQPTRGPARIRYGFISQVGNNKRGSNFLQITFFDHIDKKLWFTFGERGIDWNMIEDPRFAPATEEIP
jgi:hypothetical protein